MMWVGVGGGGQTKENFHERGMDIFWNNTKLLGGEKHCNVRVKYLAKEQYNKMVRPWLKLRPLNLESSLC